MMTSRDWAGCRGRPPPRLSVRAPAGREGALTMVEQIRTSIAKPEDARQFVKNLPEAKRLKFLEELAPDLGLVAIEKGEYEALQVIAMHFSGEMEEHYREQIRGSLKLAAEYWSEKEELRKKQLAGSRARSQKKDEQKKIIHELLREGKNPQAIRAILKKDYNIDLKEKTVMNYLSEIRNSRR
jgi:hypothetical protein